MHLPATLKLEFREPGQTAVLDGCCDGDVVVVNTDRASLASRPGDDFWVTSHLANPDLNAKLFMGILLQLPESEVIQFNGCIGIPEGSYLYATARMRNQ